MNLIEAIKSGKPFKRPSFGGYWHVRGRELMGCDNKPLPTAWHNANGLNLDDLTADDWELKPEPMEAWVNVYSTYRCFHDSEEDARKGRTPSNGKIDRDFVRVVHMREVEKP